jgi:Domain of unknown function (DUF4350)
MTTTAPPAASLEAREQPWPAGASGAGPAAAIGSRWRTPLAIVALVLLTGIVIALLKPAAPATGYLDPAGTGPFGAHALADILAERGHHVVRTVTPAAAAAAAAAAARPGGATLVVTSPGYLTPRALASLAQVPGHVVVVEPDRAALTAFAPGITLAGTSGVGPTQPDCGLAAAERAGNADMGGVGLLRPALSIADIASCYPANDSASLIQYSSGGRLITLLGTGIPLSNQALGDLGNAALALNLLSTSPRIVWLVPAPAIVAGTGPQGGQKSLTSLLPLGAGLVTIQLCIAVVLAALWRARRLGPLVPEQLPVVVRASETAEGHARLYQSRRARDRAAGALRTAMLNRVMPAVGLAPDARPDAITAALRARSGLSRAKIEMMLFGPAPSSDASLVALADDLDALEREVRAQ